MACTTPLDQMARELCGEIAVVLSKTAGSVHPEITLQSLGMDSLQLVSLLVAIENRYHINLMSAGLERADLATPLTLARRLHAVLEK